MEKEEFIDSLLSESLVSEGYEKHPENIKSTLQSKVLDNEQIRPSCKNFPEVLRNITLSCHNLSLSLLHPHYQMELYRLETSKLLVSYTQKYDHMAFSTTLNDVFIFDLTGYPYTHSPALFLENPASFNQSQRLFIHAQKMEPCFKMAFETYYSSQCGLKREGFSSKMEVLIEPL